MGSSELTSHHKSWSRITNVTETIIIWVWLVLPREIRKALNVEWSVPNNIISSKYSMKQECQEKSMMDRYGLVQTIIIFGTWIIFVHIKDRISGEIRSKIESLHKQNRCETTKSLCYQTNFLAGLFPFVRRVPCPWLFHSSDWWFLVANWMTVIPWMNPKQTGIEAHLRLSHWYTSFDYPG